jgi:integrase
MGAAGGRKPRLTEDDTIIKPREVTKLLDFIRSKKDEKSELLLEIVHFILNTGFRAEEVAEVKVEDVVLDNEIPYILVSGKYRKTKKGPDGNRIDIDEEVRQRDHQKIPTAYIPRLKALINGSDGFLFTRPVKKTGLRENLSRQWIWRHTKKAMLECGLNPRFSPHTLRHRAGVKFYSATKDIELTRDFMRHKSIKITQRYVKASALIEYQKKALAAFEVEE